MTLLFPSYQKILISDIWNIVVDYLGIEIIINDIKSMSFSYDSLLKTLLEIDNNNYIFMISININDYKVLNITSDYKGLFRKVKEINGSIKLIGDMSHMFSECNLITKLGNSCDTIDVTNMSSMFNGASSFNQILNWDTRNVIDMSGLFSRATSFNQSLNWDTGNVTDMSYMFNEATNFNGLLKFNTSNVTNMSYMFSEATSFNKPLKFNTSNVSNMILMFFRTKSFNQLLNWDDKYV